MPNAERHMRVVRQKEEPAPRPLAERGRILYAEDIQQLYGTRPNGKPRKSIAWVWRTFAPEYRPKDGKTPFWWETDALRWLDAQRESAA
jgi:hypothetical protein